ncbi:type III-B CRISPR module-associated protein Cmr5 [Paenibacillus peoriae]|jgi:CRISPR-associated protein Cmr5|uniref:type III-B CRISPR module-associated protein Cmr5 n=1 Tax=Paenibacillus peoriae TaxID=59893 RepID=UPI00096CE434|nr:type III-B CRISPR module-associated protein Cmr5 [Paenibacillus peoriae]OMF34773.1 type III-B CRISPR module-associated protein Cmr5 [Paenibacillus peoriae]
MKSVAHTYAEKALHSIRQIESSSSAKEYGRLCQLFPSMLLVNGLRLTVAFFRSKASNDQPSNHERYLSDMGAALGISNWENELSSHGMTMTEYRNLSQRALKAAVWFKRYAEAILRVEASDSMDA